MATGNRNNASDKARARPPPNTNATTMTIASQTGPTTTTLASQTPPTSAPEKKRPGSATPVRTTGRSRKPVKRSSRRPSDAGGKGLMSGRRQSAALDLRAENTRLEAELAQARHLSRRQQEQEQATRTASSASASGSFRVSNVTMSQIREHLGVVGDDAKWLCIRALLRGFMWLAALDFDISWKQQDMIRERIPRFCRFANNWAAELLVQDIFNHRRTSKEVNPKTRTQHSGASNNHQSPPSSPDDNGSQPGSPSTPDRGRASPTGWPGSHTGSRVSPVEHSPPPNSIHQLNKSPCQGGAGSNREHSTGEEDKYEDEDAPMPPSRLNGAESSCGHDAREEDEDAPVPMPCRSGRHSRPSLAAVGGAAEEDDNVRQDSGGSKKGGKGKPKPKKGGNEELFPDEGEEDSSDD
ncbi:hypothetical protein BDV93DRAFT_558030 [Ceratobasidium sp. AG-I]|nr:hypothetical protein BDV93DRAFT_558030 [Ceratobasidium sp. AG-I]